MPNLIYHSEVTLYADNTLIDIEGDTNKQCYESLDKQMENLIRWLRMNKFRLNKKIINNNNNGN